MTTSTYSGTSLSDLTDQNPDWFLRQSIAISETSRKRPPLLSDHLTKILIGSSVSQLLLVKLPVSDHLS